MRHRKLPPPYAKRTTPTRYIDDLPRLRNQTDQKTTNKVSRSRFLSNHPIPHTDNPRNSNSHQHRAQIRQYNTDQAAITPSHPERSTTMQTFNTNKSQTSVFEGANLLEVLGGNTGEVEAVDSMNQKQEDGSNGQVPNRWRSRSRHGEGEGKGRGEKRRRYRSERGGFNFPPVVSVHMVNGKEEKGCRSDPVMAAHQITTPLPFVIVTATFYQHIPDLATSGCRINQVHTMFFLILVKIGGEFIEFSGHGDRCGACVILF